MKSPNKAAGWIDEIKGAWSAFYFFHRAFAAFFAISLRRFLLSAFARAGPPFFPPSLPSATAAGFFPSADASGGAAGSSPEMRWMIPNATTAGSGRRSFFLLERFGIYWRITDQALAGKRLGYG